MTAGEIGGMVAICSGIVLLTVERRRPTHLALKPLGLAALTGITITASWLADLINGLVAVGSYGVFIWALSLGAMGTVAALRETRVLFAARIGTIILRERLGPARIVAAALITLGIVLIANAR